MAEQTLRLQPGQGGDFGAQVCGFLRDLEANAAHAGIQGKVEGSREQEILGGLGQGQGVLPSENGRADSLPDGIGKGPGRGAAQNQNGIIQARLPQLQGFQHGADAEKGAAILKQPGNLHRAVAIGIGLDNGHNRNAGLGLHRVKIVRNGVQVNTDPGVFEIQGYQLTCQKILSIQPIPSLGKASIHLHPNISIKPDKSKHANTLSFPCALRENMVFLRKNRRNSHGTN